MHEICGSEGEGGGRDLSNGPPLLCLLASFELFSQLGVATGDIIMCYYNIV